MTTSNSNEKGKTIWSRINLDQLVAAIASLCDRTDQLKDETWRLNDKTRSPSSLWREVIDKLDLDHSERTRVALYKIWHENRHNIEKLVEEKKRTIDINKNDGDDDDISVSQRDNPTLAPDPSLPLPQKPNTRLNQEKNADNNKNTKSSIMSPISLVFTAEEWKNVFSRTTQTMKPDWTDKFDIKLTSSGIRCSVKFKTPYIKQGERKKICRFFCCYARCTIGICERKYQISLRNQPDANSTVLFLVRIFGKENHDVNVAISARQLRGENRLVVGKRANEIGPLAVFREHIESADENLLAAGNYTGCETIEVLKKAAADYRKKMRIDEDIFKECRITARAYLKEDIDSTHVKGYIQVMGEMPFRLHLFSERQIERYIRYCTKEKYSYVHLDATGGVLKKMCEQNQALLYAIMFKDGIDSNDNIPLAHALLTNHTVPSINYFLGDLAHSITEVNKKLILPSFFIIDFSAAIMNSILQTFNYEHINTHLNRCWNVLYGKYNAEQLRSSSFIHLCCCHVIHAMARSLNAAHIEKKIRRGVLHIFAFMLCDNDIKQLYDTLGLVINIFGDPNEQNAKEKFERMVSLQLNADEESVSMLMDRKKIFKKAKKDNDELRLVDEYFRSNAPIIHQSPFNEEAIRLYPNLKNLINNKSKYDKIVNPLFSPSIIRIFYRWWAYLPLWTGLLWNFEERYASDRKSSVPLIYNPIRYSNATIESYFRTLKKSIYQGKVNNYPSGVVMELYRSIKAQFKAIKFDVTQSSKGRKRRKQHVAVEEKWRKKGEGKKRQAVYFNLIDKFASKRARTKMNDAQTDDVTKKISESEDTTTVSSLSRSRSSSEDSHDNISLNNSFRSSKNKSTSSSSAHDSMVSSEYSVDVRMSPGKSTANDHVRSEASIEFEFETSIASPITNTLYPVNSESNVTTDQSSKKPHDQLPSNQVAIIDGYTLRWPQFGVTNVFFEGRSYSLTLTCPLDSALFALYFLYRTDINIAGEFDNAPETSPYSTLIKVFHIVENEGWDAARISWLLEFDLLKPTDRQPKSLFGALDEQVFCFIKNQQRYSDTITCLRPNCTEKEREFSSTELSLLSCDVHIEKFEVETFGVCSAMIKRWDEITEAEACKEKYKEGRVLVINAVTNRSEYVRGWKCDAVNVHSTANFDYGHPPILITNIKPFERRSEEGYKAHPARLRDLQRIVRVGSVRYKLRAVIHHKNAHFTTTVIGQDDRLYIFDDLKGVREARSSTEDIEMAIYSQTYEF